MIRHTFYVEDFPDLENDTPVTIVIPRNADRRFAVEIELPLDVLSRLTTSPASVAFSPSSNSISPMQTVSQSLSLSPGEQRFSPRQLTPNSSRTSLGPDGRIDASRLVSPRSPLLYPASPAFSPSPTYSSPPRQPTLMEAMSQASPTFSPTSFPSPGLSPLPRVSPGYFGDSPPSNSANLSPYGLSAGGTASGDLSPRTLSALMTSPQMMSPRGPSFMGNTVVDVSDYPSPARNSPQSSPCFSPYVGGQTNRPTIEQMDAVRQYSPPQ